MTQLPTSIPTNKDIIVRRRLVQKMQFLIEDVAGIQEPSDEELQSYLDTHAERYTIPGRFSFNQVYFSRELHGDNTDTDAQNLLTQLQNDPNQTKPRSDRYTVSIDPDALNQAFQEGDI